MDYSKLGMNKKEYSKYVMSKSLSKSKICKDLIVSFIIGGFICIVGQIILDTAMYLGADKTLAGTISSVTLIFIAALLTSLKLYSKIGNFAGAGSIVPITGFSNSVVSPAIEYKSEGYVMGVGAKMFTVAGPVLVFGISSAVLVGLIAKLFVG